MKELTLRLSLLFAMLTILPAASATAAVSGHRADAPAEADVYTVMRQGPGVDEQTVRDMRMSSAIEIALFREESLNAARIRIETDNGHVHLSGTAPSEDAKALAARLARETEDVVEVTNDIKVGQNDSS